MSRKIPSATGSSSLCRPYPSQRGAIVHRSMDKVRLRTVIPPTAAQLSTHIPDSWRALLDRSDEHILEQMARVLSWISFEKTRLFRYVKKRRPSLQFFIQAPATNLCRSGS